MIQRALQKIFSAPVAPPTEEDIAGLSDVPLFSMNGIAISETEIVFSGLALPPGGDYSAVEFKSDDDVVFRTEYPLPTPGAKDYYWYWPGAEQCGFRITIDKARSHSADDLFRFYIDFDGRKNAPLERERTALFVPRTAELFENFPALEALQRVQRFDNPQCVAARGVGDAFRMTSIAAHHGWTRDGNVLDWGAGHGRVARHISRFAPQTRVKGVDIDPQNIAWAAEHLPSIDFSVGPLMPPTAYESGSFSLIYGISVMTHLEPRVQKAWLAEIHRILKPGGLALLTFSGDAAVAFISRWLDAGWIDTYLKTGVGPLLPSSDLVGVIDTPDYYKNVHQNLQRTVETCEPFLDVLGAHECMFGYQDLVILQRPLQDDGA
jgi:hypothetical protein